MKSLQRAAASAGIVAALVLGVIGAASAQTYYSETITPSDQHIILNNATMCTSPVAFRQLLVARVYSDADRATAVLAQNCTTEPAGTRVRITGAPQQIAVWNGTFTYRVLPIHVLNGPDRDMDGYIIVGGL